MLEKSRTLFTAIISDLHLCEAEPRNEKFPLWKKYKTEEFFFDDTFGDFLRHLEEKSEGQQVELVLNGDIFDFDSVTSVPEQPDFRVSWLEKRRGLFPRPERARYKMTQIIRHHSEFFEHLRAFIQRGHRVVLIAGNHDVELHFPEVREVLLERLKLGMEAQRRFRFCEWFYISGKDTLIEHGNQYDPYCLCEDPAQPFLQGYNYKMIRLPFGNLATRYLVNGMGFFNPHLESNYIMSLGAYVRFFFRYMLRAQPLIIWTWFWSSVVTLYFSAIDRFRLPIREPLAIEDRIEDIAKRSQATPRMVRELKELFVAPANANPFLIAQELWLDRAFLLVFTVFLIVWLNGLIQQVADASVLWMIVPILALLPFFLFYSKSLISKVSKYKEPDEQILTTAGMITSVGRVVYGHTHKVRHELIGSIEHLNSGCWSPAFKDVECTQPIDQKTFVWIEGDGISPRTAKLLKFVNRSSKEIL